MPDVPFRILVADDFEPLRAVVCSIIREQPGFVIIAEVADGITAVQKASKLEPDVIVLDISLPKVNGIEAARQIRKLAPKSRIIFLSQMSSLTVAQEAFSLGAWGYVVKTDAAAELPAALNAVIRGERFLSSGVAGQVFTRASERSAGPGAAFQASNRAAVSRHEVLFYSDDTCLCDQLTQCVKAVLDGGNAAIVVATDRHREKLLPALLARGVDTGIAAKQGRCILLDSVGTLSTFMVNGWPDPARMSEAVGGLFTRAAKALKREHARVFVGGQCAPILWARGNSEAAIRVEHLWGEITAMYGIDTLCAYPLDSFHGEQGQHVFEQICAEHTGVITR
jgi:DNA-binding NarL/FixJ family response regulator